MQFHSFQNFGKSRFSPETFTPIYNDEDLDTFEDLWTHTLAGDVIDTRIEHAIGDGFEPRARWRRPSKHGKDADEQEENLKEYDPLMEELKSIGEKRNISIEENVRDMAVMTKVFGRSMLAFEYEDQEETIPYSIKPIHSRLLGLVHVDQFTWQIQGVQVHTSQEFAVGWDDMMYFCNTRYSPKFRSGWYGVSDLQRVAGQCRALRTITEYDILEIAKTMWTGYGLIFVDQQNLKDEDKIEDLNTIKRSLDPGPGRISVVGKQGEKGIDVEQFKFDADVSGLTTLIDKLEKMIIGHGKVPGIVLGREENVAMSTVFAGVRYFYHGPVRHDRRWIGRTISSQWYERLATHLAPNTLTDIRIDTAFKDLPIDAWMGAVKELATLKQLIPNMPDKEILRLADLDFLQPVLAKANEEAEALQEEQQMQQMEQMNQGNPEGMGEANPMKMPNAQSEGNPPMPSQADQIQGKNALQGMSRKEKKEVAQSTENKDLKDFLNKHLEDN